MVDVEYELNEEQIRDDIVYLLLISADETNPDGFAASTGLSIAEYNALSDEELNTIIDGLVEDRLDKLVRIEEAETAKQAETSTIVTKAGTKRTKERKKKEEVVSEVIPSEPEPEPDQ